MSIRILTDSASDYPAEKALLRHVSIVPMTIHFGNAAYYDGKTIDHALFYKLLTAGEHHPSTSQPSPQAFLKHFEKAKAAGDEIICVLVSSALSGTYQSANIAKELCDYDGIYLVDSCSVAAGEQILVNYARKLRDSGLSAPDIVSELERLKVRLRIFAVVDTLEYLRKGGRLSAAKAVIGSMSHLKPILSIQDGTIAVAAKAFGTGAANKMLIKLIEQQKIDDNYASYFLYSGTDDMRETFISLMKSKNLLPTRMHDSSIGATIGTHAGPGAYGLAYIAVE